MSTITEIRSSIERDLAQLDRQIDSDKQQIRMLLADAEQSGQTTLSAADDARAEALLQSAERARAARSRKQSALAEAQKIEAEQDAQDLRMSERHETDAGRRNRASQSSRTATLSVSHNERLYHQGNDPRGTTFLRDVARAQVMQDPEAQTRLARHQLEERIERASYQERTAGDLVTGTSGAGLGGIVVPQYLVDMTAPAAAARRPFADAITRHQLPADGMSFIVPRITTATSVANQAAELDLVSTTSLNETDLTVPVRTAAGSQNVSRQAVDRSRIDEFLLSDLFAQYATNLDSTLLNVATYGLSAVALGTLGAFADTQPTGAKLYPKIFAAASGVEAVMLGTNADLCVMHSRRYNWLAKEMTNTWPMVNSAGLPVQAGAVNYNRDYGSGYRGMLANGLALVVDNNVTTTATTNQDEVYVVPSTECHLWEDASAPALIRAEQPNSKNLAILFVVFGYYGFTHQRFPSGAMQKVSGTGLTTPAF